MFKSHGNLFQIVIAVAPGSALDGLTKRPIIYSCRLVSASSISHSFARTQSAMHFCCSVSIHLLPH